jgi:hypothetical protein
MVYMCVQGVRYENAQLFSGHSWIMQTTKKNTLDQMYNDFALGLNWGEKFGAKMSKFLHTFAKVSFNSFILFRDLKGPKGT